MHAALATPPPEVPPPDIVDRLTLNGSVPLEYYYVDDSNKGMGMYSYIQCHVTISYMFVSYYSKTTFPLYIGTHYKFPYDDIATLIRQAGRFLEKALSVPIPHAPVDISSSVTWLTQLTDIWLANALKKYPITGLRIVSVCV